MKRMLTVKGVGTIRVKPDVMVVEMRLSTLKPDYQETMRLAARAVEALQEAVREAGFAGRDLKTTAFTVNTSYDNYYDRDGNYREKFTGYLCAQELKLEFAYDLDLLAKVLAAIARAPVNPQLQLRFTVKDKAAVQEKLLSAAAENARQKAKTLAAAAGVALGSLLRIDYNWNEVRLYSPTNVTLAEKLPAQAESVPEIEPDELTVSDTVTFVWEIKDQA